MSHVKLSCLNDSLSSGTCFWTFIFMVHFWPCNIFRQQASWWLPCFTPFLLSTLTQSHSLPTCHSSHPWPSVKVHGRSSLLHSPLACHDQTFGAFAWPSGISCLSLWGLEYDKSFPISYASLRVISVVMLAWSLKLIPPITIQREKPNSEFCTCTPHHHTYLCKWCHYLLIYQNQN